MAVTFFLELGSVCPVAPLAARSKAEQDQAGPCKNLFCRSAVGRTKLLRGQSRLLPSSEERLGGGNEVCGLREA